MAEILHHLRLVVDPIPGGQVVITGFLPSTGRNDNWYFGRSYHHTNRACLHDLQKIQYPFSNEQAKEVNIQILLEMPLKSRAANVKKGKLHGYFKRFTQNSKLTPGRPKN